MSARPRRLRGVIAVTLTAAALLAGPSTDAAVRPTNDGGAARSPSASDPALRGLYGGQDATYDGVYRQSLSLLALDAAGAPTQRAAVRWLLRQQCRTGQWTSYRSELSAACGRGSGDSNATAMAVMALEQVGRTAATRRAARDGVRWLRAKQLPGGGWEYSRGWGADANSTALALQALVSRGVRPTAVTVGGRSGLDFLRSLQLRCAAPAPARGALDYQPQPNPAPNDYATVQAAQALARLALPVSPHRGTWSAPGRPECTARLRLSAKSAAVGYLARRLARHDGAIPATGGPGNDDGSTANAVLALVGTGVARRQVAAAMRVLRADARAYVLDDARDTVPAAAAIVMLAVHATRGDPRDVDGLDLVARTRGSITR